MGHELPKYEPAGFELTVADCGLDDRVDETLVDLLLREPAAIKQGPHESGYEIGCDTI